MGRRPGPTQDTKHTICARALRLFSEKGYAATSVKDIAVAVGIKDASLYNHFAGKREIFDAVISWQLDRLASMLHDESASACPEDDVAPYLSTTPEDLTAVVFASYRPFFVDEGLRLMRRMLLIDRYAYVRCGELFEDIFITRPLNIQETIFSRLIEEGLFTECDSALAARQFHGPMFMLMLADFSWEQACAFLGNHLAEFVQTHRVKEGQ